MTTRHITVTQINWNGRGDNRSFDSWIPGDQVDAKLDRIAQGYNMASGRTKVTLDGRDITAQVAELKLCPAAS